MNRATKITETKMSIGSMKTSKSNVALAHNNKDELKNINPSNELAAPPHAIDLTLHMSMSIADESRTSRKYRIAA